MPTRRNWKKNDNDYNYITTVEKYKTIAFPTKNSIWRVHSNLVLGCISNEPFRVREGDVTRRCAISLIVRNNFHFSMLENSNTGVCGTKIDTNGYIWRHFETKKLREETTSELRKKWSSRAFQVKYYVTRNTFMIGVHCHLRCSHENYVTSDFLWFLPERKVPG